MFKILSRYYILYLMNIGFDLDRIFINTPPFIPAAIIERLYRKKSNGILLYRIPSRQEQIIRIISHHPLFRPGIKKNLTFVKSLASTNNNQLFLISSRFAFLKIQTDGIVKKYKLENIFQKLYFNFADIQPHIFKLEIIKKLKLDKFVDDDLYLLKYIASKNNHTKLYWLNKKLNKKISKNIRAITRISDIVDK